MKKSFITLTVFALLLLVYSLLSAQDTTQTESDFIILSYTAYGSEIYVYNGGADEKPVSCKKRDVNNCVVDLLSTYKASGYEIASTTTAATSFMNTERNGLPAIFIFLKKK